MQIFHEESSEDSSVTQTPEATNEVQPVAEKKAPPPPAKTEREINFERASSLEKMKEYDLALPLYFNLTRDVAPEGDVIYDQSLMGLARIFERTDESEKAILALNELKQRKSTVISKTALDISLMKNHFRVENYYQAKRFKTDIDYDYKNQLISKDDLYQALFNYTDIYYDRHVFNELLFISEVQKYFIFIMESETADQAEKISSLLQLYYERFLQKIDNAVLSREIKKNLIISLLDQLSKFDQYKLLDKSDEPTPLSRFSLFAETNKRKLTERLANDNY